MNKPEIIGYFVDRLEEGEEISSSSIFVAIEEHEKDITIYSPTCQHSEAMREYLNDCQRITKEEYIKISELFYTPEEYL